MECGGGEGGGEGDITGFKKIMFCITLLHVYMSNYRQFPKKKNYRIISNKICIEIYLFTENCAKP